MNIATVNTADREIVGQRIFNAPRDLVWTVWTEPAHVTKWWGPNGFTLTIHEMDVRVGGHWRFIMHGPDGTDYDNENVYVELARPERLVMDHISGPIFQMTATFIEADARTEVLVHMLFRSVEERNLVAEKYGAVEGLQQTLNRLAEYVASP